MDDLTNLNCSADNQPPEPRRHQALEIHGDLAELSNAREFVRHFCEHEVGPLMLPEDVDKMELATGECISNVIRHAYKGRANTLIQIIADAYAGQLQVRIYDRGECFDLDAVPPPALDGTQEGGFGLYIMRACVDKLEYGQDDLGRNCFTLTRSLAAHL